MPDDPHRPVTPPQISGAVIRAILRAADKAGVAPSELLGEAGLSLEEIEDGDAYVPMPAEEAVWRTAVRRVDDPTFGTKAALGLERGSFRELEYLVRSSADVREGFSKIVEYSGAVHGQALFELDIGAADARFRYLHPHGASEPFAQAATQFALASTVAMGRDAVGVDWNPVLTNLAIPQPPDPTIILELYRCPVRFGARHSELVLPLDLLDHPMPGADPILAEILEAVLRNRMHRLDAVTSTSDLVRDAIASGLASGAASLDHVARRLGRTPRAVQRRLQAEDTSYNALLESVRRDAAEAHLARGVPLSTASVLCGFSDVRAFRRAFKRWFDCTPRQYVDDLQRSKVG